MKFSLSQILARGDNQCIGFAVAEVVKKGGCILTARFTANAPLVFVRNIRNNHGMLEVQINEGWRRPFECFFYRTMQEYNAAMKGQSNDRQA